MAASEKEIKPDTEVIENENPEEDESSSESEDEEQLAFPVSRVKKIALLATNNMIKADTAR